MTKQNFVFLTLVSAAIGTLVGCELIVDFDRSKIPADLTDAGEVDGATDATTATEGGSTDGGTDASLPDATDASFDGTVFDTGTDSSFDASDDADGM